MRTQRTLSALALAVAAWSFVAVACSSQEQAQTAETQLPTTVVVPDVTRESTGGPPANDARPPGPQPSSTDGPWNRDLQVAYSDDGLTFGASAVFVERGGVPCVIRDRDGRLVAVFQWFPFDRQDDFDQVAVAFSSDDGSTWSTPSRIVVDGLPAGLMRPFDPTIVQLEDGRYRLYFTSNATGGRGKPAIYSAISADGLDYTFEEGARFAPTSGTVDAAVVWFRGAWHMFSHTSEANTGKGYHAVSTDGLAFTELSRVDVGSGRQWIGNAVATGDVLRYYGSGRDGIWSATSADGSNWTLDSGTRAAGGDPSALLLSGGKVMLVYVGGPRADAGPRPFADPPR